MRAVALRETMRAVAAALRPIAEAAQRMGRQLAEAFGQLPGWVQQYGHQRARARRLGFTGPTLSPRQEAHWHRTAGRPRRRR